MKSPVLQNKASQIATQAIILQGDTSLPTRRFTDNTPACRDMAKRDGVPTSPKIHELMERSKYH